MLNHGATSVSLLDRAANYPFKSYGTKPLPLRHNFAWTLAGNIVYAGCQWGMLIVLAKLGSPEMVGRFALALAITAPVMMFSRLNLRNVQATDARGQFRFGDYLGLRLITTSLAIIVIATTTFAAGYRRETAAVVLVVALAKGFESLSDIFHGSLQQYERMDRIAVSLMIKGPLSLMALGTGVYLTGSVFWGTIGLLAAWASLFVCFDVPIGRGLIRSSKAMVFGREQRETGITTTVGPTWELPKLKQLAWLSMPLGIVALLLSLRTNIPRYFVELYLGERDLGIFAAMAYVIVAGGTVVRALGQSASPRLARYYAQGNVAAFLKLLAKLLALGGLLAIAVLLVLSCKS